MPSTLINNTLSSLSGGVTQQYQEGRFDSQVSFMNNCIPSITRGIMRRNPLEYINEYTSIPNLEHSFVYTYDRGTGDEQYMIVVTGDGTLKVYNVNTGTLLYTSPSSDYLVAPIGVLTKTYFKALTVGDHTFIINTLIDTSFTAAVGSSSGYSDMAFYWIKKTVAVVTEQEQLTTADPVEIGSRLEGYTYILNTQEVEGLIDSRPSTSPKIDIGSAYKIATEMATKDANWTAEDAIVYRTDAPTTWDWSDTFGDEASIGVWKDVDSSEKLPANLPTALDGFLVKVSGGTSAEFDDYYLKYSQTDKTWKETVKPGASTTLDPTTMPHALYRLGDGSFEFNTYQGVAADGLSLDGISLWGDRESGGGDTLQDPSFLGRPLSNIFFFKNRLGFLTSDNIILSQTGSYGDFFIQTVQNVLDDDPIDLAVASTDVTVLRHAVPTAGQLIIFADDTQFSLTSLSGPLTPESADISALSNYTYGSTAEATAIGNRVLFANQAGGYSQIYSYKVTDRGSQITEASPMTLHLPSFIDSSLERIVGHDVLGFTFMQTDDDRKKLTVLSSVTRGQEDLQNAFHTWEFTEDIVSTNIINNDLYILFSTGTTTGKLCKIPLDIPGDIDTINYLDDYGNVEKEAYTSSIIFSKFTLRDKNGKGTVRGRYQLRTLQYTITDVSRYITNIFSTNQSLLDSDTMMGPTWIDTDVWDDTKIWVDTDPFYSREYTDDKRVTIMSDSEKVVITFKSSEAEPSKGFELATVNIEAFFHQRSTRI